MRMRIEEMTSNEFAEAVERDPVVILPIGATEAHGPHLPLGTDMMAAHTVCTLAARREPAVVFPPSRSAACSTTLMRSASAATC